MEEVKGTNLELNKEVLDAILTDAQKRLEQVSIIIPHKEKILPIFRTFIRQSMRHVVDNQSELNFCQLFDLGVDEEDLLPYMVAGQEFKLLIKSDEDSEEE